MYAEPPNSYVQPIEPVLEQPAQDELTNNQLEPNTYQLEAIKTVLKGHPQFIQCPYCKQFTPTKTISSCSFKNILLCMFSPLIWGITKACRQKEYNCYDVEHSCLNCQSRLFKYQAC